jgi:hypothetical protein
LIDDALELVDVWDRGVVLEEELEEEELEEEEEEKLSSTLQLCMMCRKAAKTSGLAGSSGFKRETSFSKRSIRSSGV